MTACVGRSEDAPNPIKTSPSPDLSLVTKNLATKPMALSDSFGTSSPGQLLIEAGSTERQYWRDLWRYRNCFTSSLARSAGALQANRRGSELSFIRPLLTMIVLTVVFGKLGKMPSGGVPYPLLVFCGMLPWQFFLPR